MSQTNSADDPARAAGHSWVKRVLGIDIAGQRQAGTARAGLLRAARGMALPGDDAQLPAALSALAPALLATLLDAPETSAKRLGPGDSVSTQDQMTDVSAQLDLLGRKLQEWAAVLDEAEAAKGWLDGEGRDAPHEDRAAAAADHNEERRRGQAIEAEVAAMAKAIRAACGGVSAAMGGGAA